MIPGQKRLYSKTIHLLILCMLTAGILLLIGCRTVGPQELKIKEFRRTGWALVIIDIQKGYMPFYNQSQVIRNVLKLRNEADEAGVPVIYIRNNDGIAKKGTTPWDFHQAITPREEDFIIDKEYPSGFTDTGLEELLRDEEVATLVSTGISTSHCFASTVYDAAARGFNVVVVSDGHSNQYSNARTLIDSYNERFSGSEKIAVIPSGEIRFPRKR